MLKSKTEKRTNSDNGKTRSETKVVQDEKNALPIPALDLYLNEHGEMVEGRRRRDGTDDITNEQRVGNRLKRVREAKGWAVEELANALNVSAELMVQIESGRRDVPHSRAIRVEAKLQQWETEISAAERTV